MKLDWSPFFVKVSTWALTLVLMHFSAETAAQKKFTSKGEAQIRIENNMSKDAARAKARELAIVNAIENVLGTYVEQETNIDISQGQANFKIIGNNRVKGEWLETDKEEFNEESRVSEKKGNKEYELWMTCQISGTVREIVKPKLDFQTESLSCPKSNCRTTNFSSGEQLFVYFRTPSRGNLSIYAVQDDQTVYRLLPYQEMDVPYEDAVPVKADQEYIFFSKQPSHNYFTDFSLGKVDEMVLETMKDKEFMQLYVVFSTEKFSKPILNSGKVVEQGLLPKSLSQSRFEEWIQNNRIYNPEFNYEVVNLTINKK